MHIDFSIQNHKHLPPSLHGLTTVSHPCNARERDKEHDVPRQGSAFTMNVPMSPRP